MRISVVAARAALLGVALLAVAACDRLEQRQDAAADVKAFLAAARSGDQAAFERHIDRPALKAQLRTALAAQNAIPAGVPPQYVEPLLDQLISPQSFQIAARGLGGGAREPSTVELAASLKPAGDGRLCLSGSATGPCAATFAEQDGVWKLVAIDTGSVQVRTVGPERR